MHSAAIYRREQTHVCVIVSKQKNSKRDDVKPHQECKFIVLILLKKSMLHCAENWN
jgi:hypothetical protein